PIFIHYSIHPFSFFYLLLPFFFLFFFFNATATTEIYTLSLHDALPISEPVAGATLGAAVPCDDYWPKIVEVCRAHGILVIAADRSEEHTSELQSRGHLVCRLLLEKKKKKQINKDMKKNHN